MKLMKRKIKKNGFIRVFVILRFGHLCKLNVIFFNVRHWTLEITFLLCLLIDRE